MGTLNIFQGILHGGTLVSLGCYFFNIPGDFSFSNYISVAMIEMCKDDIMSLNDMASILLFLQKPKLRSVAEAVLVIDKAKILWDEDFPTNHE